MIEYLNEAVYLGTALATVYGSHKGLEYMARSAANGMTDAEIEMTLDPDNNDFNTNRILEHYLSREHSSNRLEGGVEEAGVPTYQDEYKPSQFVPRND